MGQVQGEVQKDGPAAQESRGLRMLFVSSARGCGQTTIASLMHAELGGSRIHVDSAAYAAALAGNGVEVFSQVDREGLRSALMGAGVPVLVDVSSKLFRRVVDLCAHSDIDAHFDYVVIVTDTTVEGQRAAIGTYKALRETGMPQEKFRIVLNQFRLSRPIRAQYQLVFAFRDEEEPTLPLDEACAFPKHDLFKALEAAKKTFREALDDKQDYAVMDAQAERAGDRAAMLEGTNNLLAQTLAHNAAKYVANVMALFEVDSLGVAP